eukprot:11196727-Lingulodinium_polyedra.AAC.1
MRVVRGVQVAKNGGRGVAVPGMSLNAPNVDACCAEKLHPPPRRSECPPQAGAPEGVRRGRPRRRAPSRIVAT